MATVYDLYMQGKPEEGLNGFRTLTFGYSRTVAVRGPYKLATQWLKRFLTRKGSDPNYPDYGTDFPRLLGASMGSPWDARDVLILAIQDCNDQIYTAQRQTLLPLDEQLLTAVLSTFEVNGPDSVEAWVTISNAQGTKVPVQLPIL